MHPIAAQFTHSIDSYHREMRYMWTMYDFDTTVVYIYSGNDELYPGNLNYFLRHGVKEGAFVWDRSMTILTLTAFLFTHFNPGPTQPCHIPTFNYRRWQSLLYCISTRWMERNAIQAMSMCAGMSWWCSHEGDISCILSDPVISVICSVSPIIICMHSYHNYILTIATGTINHRLSSPPHLPLQMSHQPHRAIYHSLQCCLGLSWE